MMQSATHGILSFATTILLVASLWGCGQTGGTVSVNDPEPTGTIVAQASFSGVNGKSASGNAIIYKVSDGAYILRLSGIIFPEENGLQLIVVANSAKQSPLTLRASTGNQNYSFGVSASAPTFNQVKLYSIFAFEDYAEALFTN